jgi:hypothetical protein
MLTVPFMRPITLLAVCCFSTAALAKPPGPATFCATYPTAPVCMGGEPACTYCHTSPPTRNVYGMSVESHLLVGAPRPLSDNDYAMGLPAALHAAENEDSDGDGVSNIVEIQKGTAPSDPQSYPADIQCAGPTNPSYTVCTYDPRYVYRKVLLDFCGYSPTYAQMQSFDALALPAQTQLIDDSVTACVKTDLWRGKNGQLWELAHPKVRPIGSLKGGSEDQGIVPLADYYDDYDLFTWTQTDSHDARDILTANYYVTRTGTNPTVYAKVADSPSSEFVDVAHRAGNMTTAWALGYFVMFTGLPRTAAAQAYRGYLGLDIAKQEGLYPVPGEPKDYDQKGVTGTLCTQCHATLDPLSYPFRNYNGLTGNQNSFEQYVPMRMETIAPFSSQSFLSAIPENGYIFNQPVANLTQWAQVAADSDQFARATVLDYWNLLIGAPPTAEQNDEFVALWQGLKANGYSIDLMLHALVKTEAYGAP